MKVVKGYGALKKRLGQGTFEFNVNSPAQALRALCANFKGLEKWFIDSEKDGVAYKVLVGKEEIGDDNIQTLALPMSEKEIFSITPVVMGAGRGGWGRVLFGAALIGASFLFPGAGMFGANAMTWGSTTATAIGTTIGTVVSGVGAAMVLGGISEMLTPTPKAPRDASRNESYGFGGVANSVRQGTPVPICYGRLYVGSSVISIGLDTDQVA